MAAVAASNATAAVHVDPEGPAGQQYALPLDKARVDAGGGDESAAVPGGEAEAPLFGEGVDSKSQSQGPGAAGGESNDAVAGIDEGGDGTLRLAGILVAVLLIGGALGLGLRRTSAQT